MLPRETVCAKKKKGKSTGRNSIQPSNTPHTPHHNTSQHTTRNSCKMKRHSKQEPLPPCAPPSKRRNDKPATPPLSASNKLTRSESMLRVRERIRDYSSSCLLSSTDDAFDLRFMEGKNQLTFSDDDRFLAANIFFGDTDTVSHKHVRDLGCQGLTSHVDGERLRVGDNVYANFKEKGRWYAAHVTKANRGKYDLQYRGTSNPKP